LAHQDDRATGWFSWKWFGLGMLLGFLWGLWRHPGSACCCLVRLLLLAALAVTVLLTMVWMHPGFALVVLLMYLLVRWARRSREQRTS